MRQRWFFVAVPVLYAAAVYLIIGLTRSRAEQAEVLFLVVGISVAAGVVASRFAGRLQAARTQAERGREELALVGKLSATLSGPLTPSAVASQFLAGIAGLLPSSVVATLLQY